MRSRLYQEYSSLSAGNSSKITLPGYLLWLITGLQCRISLLDSVFIQNGGKENEGKLRLKVKKAQ